MEQDLALGVMLSGRNCFLTGAAGAGKTYVLNKFIEECRRRKRRVAVTASTGIAATHVGGNTIHSWSGIGGHEELPRNFFVKMPKSRVETIRKTEVLVIDEISMLHDWFFEMLDKVCREVRDSEEAFGGVQVVVCGDFFQLPPVVRGGSASAPFVTKSMAWKRADFTVLYLVGNYRQEDMEYLEILNRLRDGGYRRGQIEKLLGRVGAELSGEVTELYTHNYAVDRVNERRLRLVAGEEMVYEYTHTGTASYYEKLARNILAPEVLRLKVGALVMAVKNVPDKGYYNGSVGTVVGFVAGFPEVEWRTGRRMVVEPATWELVDGEVRRASVTQVPLRLAWAITVHKSQGMTLDAAKVDLTNAFEKGMGYVALSRVKSLTALSLVGLGKGAIAVSEEAMEMDKGFRERSGVVAIELMELAQVGREVLLRKEVADRDGDGMVNRVRVGRAGKELTPEEVARKERWALRVEKERERWPNARRPWSGEDSDLLVERFLAGDTLGELEERFGRKPRSIMMRLNESFAEELFSEDELWGRV